MPIGKEFTDKGSARIIIQEISRENNVPFETIRSDRKYLLMGCKHFGAYRKGTKNVEITGKISSKYFALQLKTESRCKKVAENEEEENVIRRPNRLAVKTECPADVYVRKAAKTENQPWVIKRSHFEHNHPISKDMRTYARNRQLSLADQEFAINMMLGGITPSRVLEVMLKNKKKGFGLKKGKRIDLIIVSIQPLYFCLIKAIFACYFSRKENNVLSYAQSYPLSC